MNPGQEMVHLTSSPVNSNDTYLWHLRMGHLNVSDIRKLPNCVDGVTLTPEKDIHSIYSGAQRHGRADEQDASGTRQMHAVLCQLGEKIMG
ncbi:hypothetical protein evm_014946 [Chilo suppressalis]|nr:hypothetical protein evm_014946 [Chilo suppressalis]